MQVETSHDIQETHKKIVNEELIKNEKGEIL